MRRFTDTRSVPYWSALAFDDSSGVLSVCSQKGDVRVYSMATGQLAFSLPAPVGLTRSAYGVAYMTLPSGAAALAVAQDLTPASAGSSVSGAVTGEVAVFAFAGNYSTLALPVATGIFLNSQNQLGAATLAPLPAGSGAAFLAASNIPYLCGLPVSETAPDGCGRDPSASRLCVWDVSQPVSAPPPCSSLPDGQRIVGWRGVSADGTTALLATTQASYASLLLWEITGGPNEQLLVTSTCAACADASEVRVLQAGSAKDGPAWGRVIVVGPFSRPAGVAAGAAAAGTALVQVFESPASANISKSLATFAFSFDILSALDSAGNANKRVSVALSPDGAYVAATEGRHTAALWKLSASNATGGSVGAPQQLAPLLLLSWGAVAAQPAHFQVDFSPDGGWLTVLDDTGVTLFQTSTLLAAAAKTNSSPASFKLGPASAAGSAGPVSLAWSADSGQVFVGYADGTMRAFAAQAACQNGGLWPLGGTEVIDTGYVPTIVTAGGGWVAVTGTTAGGNWDLIGVFPPRHLTRQLAARPPAGQPAAAAAAARCAHAEAAYADGNRRCLCCRPRAQSICSWRTRPRRRTRWRRW